MAVMTAMALHQGVNLGPLLGAWVCFGFGVPTRRCVDMAKLERLRTEDRARKFQAWLKAGERDAAE